MMWMEFMVKRAVRSVTATNASTLFPGCVWLPPGFIGSENFGKLFLSFFLTVFCREFKSRKREFRPDGRSHRAFDTRRK